MSEELFIPRPALSEEDMLSLRPVDFQREGWEVTQLDDQIFLVKDFITSEDRARIYDEAESYSEDDWIGEYMNHLRDKAEYEFGTRDIEQLNKDGKMEITWDWADKNLHLKTVQDIMLKLNQQIINIIKPHEHLIFYGLGTIQRQYEGSELRVHVDNYVDPYVAYAAIIYINDDYTDGELIFPTRDLKLHVPAGSMMVFPATADYPHGVLPPGPGPKRYVLPTFISMPKYPDAARGTTASA